MITQEQLKAAGQLRKRLERIGAKYERRCMAAGRAADNERAATLAEADPEVLRILGVQRTDDDSLDDCPIK